MTARNVKEFAQAAAVEHENLLLRYLRRRLRRREDPHDLAQEVYLRLLRIKEDDQVMRIRDPMAYVYVVARRVIADWHTAPHHRIRENEVSLDEVQDEIAAAADPTDRLLSDPAERLARQQLVERVFDRLPPIQKAALLYHIRDGLPFKEVAKRLNLSAKMAQYYVSQAIARIRSMSAER